MKNVLFTPWDVPIHFSRYRGSLWKTLQKLNKKSMKNVLTLPF